MEYSEKYNFYLPSRDGDDIADINQISDNFRIIEENIPSKNDLDDAVSNATVEVDQTYNPNSPNAQSGVAVAEAIGKASETWEKITETTLTEQAVVNIAKDGEGNLLALKKFKILVQMPTVTSATTVWLKVNKIVAMFTQPSSASGTPAYSINGEYTYEWQLSTCTHPANAFGSSPIYATPYGHRYASGGIPSPCTSIGLALDSAFTQGLPEGARIRIWGAKA